MQMRVRLKLEAQDYEKAIALASDILWRTTLTPDRLQVAASR